MEMIHLELHQPSWPYHTTFDSSLDHELCFHNLDHMEIDMGNSQFPSSSSSFLCNSSEFSDSIPFISPLYYGESLVDQQPSVNMEESGTTTSNETLSFDEVEAFFNWREGENDSPSQEICSKEESIDDSSAKQPLVFPQEDMELDDKVSIPHLLKACGEAMENQRKELVEVILKRLEEKACPKGGAAQRLVYYLIQSLDEHLDYLTHEARKNYEAAFRAFYQIFPYGRFAHFVANSLILEAVPEDAERVCIVDFDMGEGVQWPSLIEAIGMQNQRAIRLISIKRDDSSSVPSIRRFEMTKARLCEFAFSCGLRLEVEEMEMEGLVSEMKRMKNCGGREFLAFNCMVGFPHMGRQRSASQVSEFLKVAQDSISTSFGGRKSGIMTFGDGNGVEETTSGGGFGSFFEGQLGRVTALLESMECQMPSQLKEARIAMECLFVAPSVSSLTCFEKWEKTDWRGGILPKIGLDARRVSKAVIAEAKELVRDGDSLYWVGTKGEKENQVVLCFVGTPLVRVSCWS